MVVSQKTITMPVTSPVLRAWLWKHNETEEGGGGGQQLEAASVLISLAGESALAMFTKDISHD